MAALALPTDDSDEELVKCCLEIEKEMSAKQEFLAVAAAASMPAIAGEKEAGDTNPSIEKSSLTQCFFPFVGDFTPCNTQDAAPKITDS